MTRLGLHPGIGDNKLCQLLLAKGTLTDDQLTELVAAAARVAAGGHLRKNERDRWMAVAAAQGLLKKTQIKRSSQAPTMNINGDIYSTRVTEGTGVALQVLARGRTPSGHMLAPPSRRRAG